MRKRIVFLILGAVASLSTLGRTNSLDAIRLKYPYGILTEDYGMLSDEDFRINACIATPAPVSETKISNYPIWQCFETRDFKTTCEGAVFDSDEGSQMTSLVISTTANTSEIQEFFVPIPMKLQDCEQFFREWDKYTLNEKYVCICGSLPQGNKKQGGKKVTSWVFNRFKTKKGCDSYAKGQCDLSYHIGRGNCPID